MTAVLVAGAAAAAPDVDDVLGGPGPLAPIGDAVCVFEPATEEVRSVSEIYYDLWSCSLATLVHEPLGVVGCTLEDSAGVHCGAIDIDPCPGARMLGEVASCLEKALETRAGSDAPSGPPAGPSTDVRWYCAMVYPWSEVCQGDHEGIASYVYDKLL